MDALQNIPRLITEVGFTGLLDIAVVNLVIYAFLVAVKRTRRSGLILTGLVIVGLLYLVARKLSLTLTVALLQGFFAVILIAFVVIFQEDLRYFFERVGLWWRERSLPRYKRRAHRLPRREVEILARTLGDLARARIGALVVIRGRDALARHLVGGEEVQGRLSEPLLKSIFDPHSLGHDGAVIINGDRIDRLGVHLPLSMNLEKLPRSGTRHAAALGLSERGDALCIVVSEERGAISVARRGDIRTVADAAELAAVLEVFYDEISPRPSVRFWPALFRHNYREKVVALVVAVGLWFLVAHRAQEVERTFTIAVKYDLLGPELQVKETKPEAVRVTFRAPRKAFDFFQEDEIKLTLELWDAQPGRRQYRITRNELSYPPTLKLEDIAPRQVVVVLEKRPANNTGGESQ
jgi:uncharacterized protein (TIGR00159 family)